MTVHSDTASCLSQEELQNEIFISYSRRDKAFVQTLEAALRNVGKDPWVDWEDIQPSENWWEAIKLGIEGADTFIFIVSPDSVTSQVCRQEVEHAVLHHKRLIPILWKDGFDMADVHPAISQHNWIFFQDPATFDQSLQLLLAALELEIDYLRLHTRLMVRAKEWERKGYDTSFLLQGKSLEEAQQWLSRGERLSPSPIELHRQYIHASYQQEIERQEAELRLRRMTPQQYRNRQALLNKVNHYWIKGVLHNSLQGQVLAELNLTERTDLVTHPWQMTLESPETGVRPVNQGTRMIALFDQLGEGRTLLILGAPGAGKTTLLLTLTQDLLTRAENGLDHRIPVVFNLSSWQGGKQTIAEWLIEELHTKYQVPEAIGQAWLQEQQLLLLLDGLDEVRTEKRNACVAALNFFQQQSGAEMVVCSRLQDYEVLSKRLSFQSAVHVQALTLEQVHQLLDQSQADLNALKRLLEEDAALQELAKSPLMLNVMILAYQGQSLVRLPDMTLEERCCHLLNSFVERMFKRRGVDEPYSKQQTIHWLNWLAQRMSQDSRTVFLIEDFQPSWLQTGFQQTTYRIMVEMVVGLIWGISMGALCRVLNYNIPSTVGFQVSIISGLLSGFLTGALHRFYPSSTAGLLAGIIGTLIFGFTGLRLSGFQPLNTIIFGLVFGILISRINHQEIEPVDTAIWSSVKGKKNFAFGLIWGLLAGSFLLVARRFLLTENFSNQFCGSSPALEKWAGSVLINFLCQADPSIHLASLGGLLALGIFVGGIIGIILGFKKVSEVERRTIPNQGMWNSALNMIKLIFLVGPMTGVLSWFVWNLYYYSAHDMGTGGAAVNSSFIWWIHYGNTPLQGAIFGLSVGCMVGLLGGLVGGDNSGFVCLQHFVVRLVLWKNGYIPWNQARFLNYATERIFLQKVGSGYIFTHRLLLEHFAQMKRP